jgi:hypothetical protein
MQVAANIVAFRFAKGDYHKFTASPGLKRPTSKSASERVASAPSPTRSRFELVEIVSLRAK